MPHFFFPVDYDGFHYGDERGEHFSTAEAAAGHAKLIADELSRNHSKPVTVFVVAEDGSRVDEAAGTDGTQAGERVTRRA
jgi:hypothetical protein